MPKVHIIPVTVAALAVLGCAQQPVNVGPLAIPMSQTASADWGIPIAPGDSLAQTDDETEPATLEDRARAIFGNKPLRSSLPDNSFELRSCCSNSCSSEIAGQRGNLQLGCTKLPGNG